MSDPVVLALVGMGRAVHIATRIDERRYETLCVAGRPYSADAPPVRPVPAPECSCGACIAIARRRIAAGAAGYAELLPVPKGDR